MIATSKQPDGRPAFWNEKYAGTPHLFGTAPNAFIAAEAPRIPAQADVLELGAGEGRNAVFLARQGHRVTVMDFSPVALEQAAALAQKEGVSIEFVEADARTWQPERAWDAIVASFIQLREEERPGLWQSIPMWLRPGGLFLGVFFTPEQRTEGYTSGGPPTVERLITAEELQQHFGGHEILHLEEREIILDDGPLLNGPAAVVEVIVRMQTAAFE